MFGWQTWAFTFPERQTTWVMVANAAMGLPSKRFPEAQTAALEVFP